MCSNISIFKPASSEAHPSPSFRLVPLSSSTASQLCRHRCLRFLSSGFSRRFPFCHSAHAALISGRALLPDPACSLQSSVYLIYLNNFTDLLTRFYLNIILTCPSKWHFLASPTVSLLAGALSAAPQPLNDSPPGARFLLFFPYTRSLNEHTQFGRFTTIYTPITPQTCITIHLYFCLL